MNCLIQTQRLLRLVGIWLLASSASGATPPEDLVRLTQEHSDIRAVYDPAAEPPLSLVLRNEDQRTNYAATNIVIVVPESARLEIPEGFDVFGAVGSPLWVLQQSQVAGQPFLGLSAEGLPTGSFRRDIRFHLLNVTGPGFFFAWQATEFGSLDVNFNSRDGISPTDLKLTLLGSHEHMNWGFTAPGYYQMTLQVELKTPSGSSILSQPTPFLFAVEPLPALTPFEAWQSAHFPNSSDPAITGPEADPDRDGGSNLAEFFFGTDPTKAADKSRTSIDFTPDGAVRISYVTPAARREQVLPTVSSRIALGTGNAEPLPALRSEPTAPPEGENGEWIRWWVEDTASPQPSQKFYSLRLQLR